MFMGNKAGQNLPQWLPLDLRQVGFTCLQPSHLGEGGSLSGGRMCIGQGGTERGRVAFTVRKNLTRNEQGCLGHTSAPVSKEGKEKCFIF